MSLNERFDATLEAARAGSSSALADLYRDLYPAVLRYLRAMDPSEAEDVASEVWLDVARGLDRFQGDEHAFRRWVFTIARRRLIDLRRRRVRRATFPAAMEQLEARAPIGDVENEAMDALSTDAALARIAALPPDQAEVILLRVLGDLPVNEVAAIMG
jgi:RNA polymerase sigma-70 factor (ECF subfamily)